MPAPIAPNLAFTEKKIAIVLSGKSSTAVPGGLGAYAQNACSIFDQLGYQVFLIGYGTQASTSRKKSLTQITVPSRLTKLSSLAAPIISRQLTAAAQTVIAQSKATHVVVFGAGIWAASGCQLKRRLNGPNISLISIGAYFTTFSHEYHGQIKGAPASDYGIIAAMLVRLSYFSAKFLSVYEQRVLNSLDEIVIHYEASRKILVTEFPQLEEQKLRKIPYYVDFFQRAGDSLIPKKQDKTDEIHIVIICRQDPRKGINIFLHAIKRLAEEKTTNFHCSIAGSGIFLNRNIHLAQKLKVDHIVQFLGFVPSSEALISTSNIIVLPSYEEGAGAISLLEAMKVGRPIIASSCDGIAEDLTHGKSALLFQPGNTLELVKHLRSLTSDKSQRDQLAENAENAYRAKFSFQKMKTGIEKLLKDHAW